MDDSREDQIPYRLVEVDGTYDLVPIDLMPGETDWDAVLRIVGEAAGGTVTAVYPEGRAGDQDVYRFEVQGRLGVTGGLFSAWR